MRYFLTEEFIDELAKRVAKKIAQKHYRNKLFNETRKPYTHVYESGCGSTQTTYGGCGSSTVTYGSGCGSGSQSYYGGC